MRIVDWAEFQKLPENTIFQGICGNGGSLGELMILAEVWSLDGRASDFVAASLLPAICDASSLDDPGARSVGLSKDSHARLVIMPSAFGRDGMFDYTRHWLIWEEEDRKRLAGWLLDPAKAAEQQNDDPHAFVVLPEDL